MRLKSVMPIARQRASCSGVSTTRRAKISPPRQRIAAAVSTPSGAPPMPITAWTPLPITAAVMPADRSPSPIRRMRAPVARMSAISFSWRGRSSTITTRSSTRRPSDCAMARRLNRTGASRSTTSRELGPTISFSM